MTHPHAHTHGHDADRAHAHGGAHTHAHPAHAPIVPGWSLLRLSVLERLAIVSMPLALLWATTFALIG